VLTHRPPDDDPNVTFVSGDIGKAVQTGLAAAGDKNLGLFGADVGSQCLAAGLVDEILVFVLPVLLGAGVPLFRSDEQVGLPLEEPAPSARDPRPACTTGSRDRRPRSQPSTMRAPV
jgi:dihydrofolate reductase